LRIMRPAPQIHLIFFITAITTFSPSIRLSNGRAPLSNQRLSKGRTGLVLSPVARSTTKGR